MQVGELDDESKRCTFENCTQVDFLASRCLHCGAIYCTSHTSAESHKCRAFCPKTVICPVCEFHVPLDHWDQLPDDAISLHLDTKCHSRNRAVQPGGVRCAVKDCTSTRSVTARCEDCRGLYCIEHRAPARHSCRAAGPMRAAAAAAAAAAEERKRGAKSTVPVFKAQKEGEMPLCIPRNTPRTALGKATDDPRDSVTLLVTLTKEMNVKPFFMIFPRTMVVGRALDRIVAQATLDSAQVAAVPGSWSIYFFQRTANTGGSAGLGALMEPNSMKTLQSLNIENGGVVFVGKREMMTAQVTRDICAYLQTAETNLSKRKKKEACDLM